VGFAEGIMCCPSQSLPIHVYRDATCEEQSRYPGKDSAAGAEVMPAHPLCMQRAVCVE